MIPLKMLIKVCIWSSLLLLTTEAANGKRSYGGSDLDAARPFPLSNLFKRYDSAMDLPPEPQVLESNDLASALSSSEIADAMRKLEFLWDRLSRQRRSADGLSDH